MLDTAFERPPGDVGNAASWPFPVLFQQVGGATARKVVDGAEADLLDAFAAAGEDLARRGACALITSCGFLVLRQDRLAARLGLPIATSSLLQLPTLRRVVAAGCELGVVTYDDRALTAAHFAAAGALPAPVVGLPATGRFHGLIERGERYDAAALEQELVDAVARLLARPVRFGALLFECTNLSPFSARIAERFRLPVFDVLTLGRWLHAAASPRLA